MNELTHPTTNPPPCQPLPSSAHWPIGGTNIVCGSPSDSRQDNPVVPLTVTLQLSDGVMLDQDATVSLLYVVNGSLDYSRLFAQTEVARHTTATFKAGQSETSFTITTLPIHPGSTFELEIIAYAANAGTIISGTAKGAADDKTLKALNALATTALVTALGALALALLKRND